MEREWSFERFPTAGFFFCLLLCRVLFGGGRHVGFSVTVVNKNPTKCATTRHTKTGNLEAMLFRGGTVKKMYLGRKYVPAGALLCSTGILSGVGKTSGCNISISKLPTFSVRGVVDHGSGAIGGLAKKIAVAMASCNMAVIRRRTLVVKRGSKQVRVDDRNRSCRIACLVIYANSSAIVPPVGKLASMSC